MLRMAAFAIDSRWRNPTATKARKKLNCSFVIYLPPPSFIACQHVYLGIRYLATVNASLTHIAAGRPAPSRTSRRKPRHVSPSNHVPFPNGQQMCLWLPLRNCLENRSSKPAFRCEPPWSATVSHAGLGLMHCPVSIHKQDSRWDRERVDRGKVEPATRATGH